MMTENIPMGLVQSNDELAKAIAAAQLRIQEINFMASKTFIDNISIKDFAEWDASSDLALVADESFEDENDYPFGGMDIAA